MKEATRKVAFYDWLKEREWEIPEVNCREEYTPKQAADILESGTETLKKYALLLEHNGHPVHRNARNHRVYNGIDIALIKAMIKLNREKSMPLEDAASKVTSSDVD
ncbi:MULTISPECIES: MerR family transcriptional regulator [Bacillales]|uniref:MerR family transcriptional regulator n=1 Tax=Bacillales TaxID=1385 RepID=UPI001F4DBA62|nr:MerR family transcriptional regulator [Lysinibacillus halotolerans]